MITSLTVDRLGSSVLAVPPLCRNRDYSLNAAENAKLVQHIEAGGVRTLLYGGNANFYHLPLAEYEATLEMLGQIAGRDTLVIPSAGPAFGLSLDQAKVLRRFRFPTVMVLPQVGVTTDDGVEEGIRRFVEAAGVKALLYVKNDGYIEVENVGRLADAGVISGIKYATVRTDPAKDEYLKRLADRVDRRLIISGIGEQPAIVHLRDFGLGGFTSGCVSVAPALSVAMLSAIREKRWDEAERIRAIFKPLEDLRNAINPIRVLHEAHRLGGIAETGPLLPLLSNVGERDWPRIADAARRLLQEDYSFRKS
jgi:dihydrodipicolinate synthase/N-acetylneuraminate lyase